MSQKTFDSHLLVVPQTVEMLKKETQVILWKINKYIKNNNKNLYDKLLKPINSWLMGMKQHKPYTQISAVSCIEYFKTEQYKS